MKLPYRLLLLVLGTTASAVDDRIDDSAWHDAVAIDKFDQSAVPGSLGRSTLRLILIMGGRECRHSI